jgi:eukaryotic-like serine/threonine-protein kinase
MFKEKFRQLVASWGPEGGFVEEIARLIDEMDSRIPEGSPMSDPAATTLPAHSKVPPPAEGTFVSFGSSSVPVETPVLPAEEVEAKEGLGRYKEAGLLGIGGMGEVRRVRDPSLKCMVAMKIMSKDFIASDFYRARFIEEAQVIAQLQHPNIPAVHELGQLGDGRPYFTMQEIRGFSFAKVIRRVHAASADGEWRSTQGGWSFRRLVEVFHQACEAVAYAHSKGVLHRDLKPSNIMVGDFGEVLVVDWGLAKVLGTENATAPEDRIVTTRSQRGVDVTEHGHVEGTPAYMSPEQARGEVASIDVRSDVYALGAILYELLTDAKPYVGETSVEVIGMVLSGPPLSLPGWKAASDESCAALEAPQKDSALPLPAELVRACEIAMERLPEKRYQQASELVHVLRSWLDGARRREQAMEVVSQAQELLKEAQVLRAKAALLQKKADDSLRGVGTWEKEARRQRDGGRRISLQT